MPLKLCVHFRSGDAGDRARSPTIPKSEVSDPDPVVQRRGAGKAILLSGGASHTLLRVRRSGTVERQLR